MSILHADHFSAQEVADLAIHTLRQPGRSARLDDLSLFSYSPKCNTRIWVLEDVCGRIVSEEPSLYKAIHNVAVR